VSYHHRQRKDWGRNPRAEQIATVVVLALIVVALVVFLFVYHDLPLRVS
jgi:hypothetical protein